MSWTVFFRALFALWLFTFALIGTLVWSTLRYVLLRIRQLLTADSLLFVYNLALLRLELLSIASDATLVVYFFVHSSHYDFSPSRLLQLWFEALCGMSYCTFVNCWRQIPCCSFRADNKNQLQTISHFLDSNFSASHLMQLWLKQLVVWVIAHFTLFDSTLRTFAYSR